METIILQFIQIQEKYTATFTGIIAMLISIIFILSILYAKSLFDKQKEKNQA